MKHMSAMIVSLATALVPVGVARADEQTPSATTAVEMHRSLLVPSDGALDHGGGAKKAGDGGRVQVLRCYQRGVRVLDEPISGGPSEALTRGSALQARASDGRKLAVYAVGNGLCIVIL